MPYGKATHRVILPVTTVWSAVRARRTFPYLSSIVVKCATRDHISRLTKLSDSNALRQVRENIELFARNLHVAHFTTDTNVAKIGMCDNVVKGGMSAKSLSFFGWHAPCTERIRIRGAWQQASHTSYL
jgi:hypothetical protein